MSADNIKYGEYTASRIHAIHRVRDFIKDRAELEREFSKRLEQLGRKHLNKNFPEKDEPENDAGTMNSIWARVLADTIEQSKLHKQLSEMLNISVLDKVKTTIEMKTGSNKAHLDFATKYHQIAESMRHEVEKLRAAYDSACFAVEVAKDKFERSRFESSAERNKMAWHQEILEMHNLKNEYLLALQVNNQLVDRGKAVDLPIVIGQFEDYAKDSNAKLLDIWKSIKSAESEIFRGLVDVSQNTIFAIEHVQPEKGTEIDASVVVDHESLKLHFIPCQLWKDDPEFITNEFASIYLGNRLEKMKSEAEVLDNDIKMKIVLIEGLHRLKESYAINPLKGDPDVVQESILEEERILFFLKIEKFKLQVKITSIVDTVGEFPPGSKMHDFKPAKFAMPTNCDHCQNLIWSFSTKQGLKCKVCNYNSHVRCELKLPPTCSRVKRVYNPKQAKTTRVAAHSYPGPTDGSSDQHSLQRRITSVGNMVARPEIQDKFDEFAPVHPTVDGGNERDQNQKISFDGKPAKLSDASLVEPLAPGSPVLVLFNYNATDESEATVREGEKVLIVKPDNGGWTVIAKHHTTGAVPTAYLHPLIPNVGSNTTINEEPVSTTMKYMYEKKEPEELTVAAGDPITILAEDDGSGWSLVATKADQGYVPTSYISLHGD